VLNLSLSAVSAVVEQSVAFVESDCLPSSRIVAPCLFVISRYCTRSCYSYYCRSSQSCLIKSFVTMMANSPNLPPEIAAAFREAKARGLPDGWTCQIDVREIEHMHPTILSILYSHLFSLFFFFCMNF
jgi:hypothetical protein